MTNIIATSEKLYELENRLSESWPVGEWRDSHVLLGVSGGPDSTAMLRALASLKAPGRGTGELFVAHLNHLSRGQAADADEDWLKALCERLQIPLEVSRTDVAAIALEQGDGWEAAARAARYDFLRRAAERVGARFVLTAHTADDQAETVLHRLLRGTGIEGLAGIPKARPLSPGIALVRPLLQVWRHEVIEYLAAIGQDFRTDASNQDTRWTRNRLRHELLPQLRDYNPKVDTALVRLAEQAHEAQQVIERHASALAEKCVVADAAQARINCGQLTSQPPIIVREVCKVAWRLVGWPEQSMGFDQWQQLAALATGADLQSINLPWNIHARREGQFVILNRVD